jgi:peptide chain release factor 1
MRALAEADDASLRSSLTTTVKETFPRLLLKDSPTSQMGAMVELKAGVGGAESTLFTSELARMYERVASTLGFSVMVMNRSEVDGAGAREIVLEVKGEGAYDALRTESGVHRVQRVPATETSGRTHTSTVTVLVCLSFSFFPCPYVLTAGTKRFYR